jgi:DNA-binding NarL/FixJ family response regulator
MTANGLERTTSIDSEPAVRCLIVDDDAAVTVALRRLLERQGFCVVGVTLTLTEALRRMGDLSPDVVLVDMSLGAENESDFARWLAATGARAPVVLISADPELASTPMAASSAIGFLSKTDLSADSIHELMGRTKKRRHPRDRLH